MIINEIIIGGRRTLVIRCGVCNCEFRRQKRVFRISAWPNLCGACATRAGKYGAPTPKRVFRCARCEASIWRGSTYCKRCAQKGPEKTCNACGAVIDRKAKALCLSCHNKKQDRGLSRERTKFTISASWRSVREACFRRDNFTCQECKVRGGELHAHHIKSWALFPELRLDLNNLRTMCKPCHMSLHRLTKKAA